MTLTLSDAEAYTVIARKDLNFDGAVFVGVTTTGIFCRPGCPARLPKFENCTFHSTANAALAAGYRACKRCHPAKAPGAEGPLVTRLIAMVEEAPQRRISEATLKEAGIDPSTARRQFQARFKMSFTQYARARRLALAAQEIGKGDSVISAQITAGYESASGFREAFGKTFGGPPQAGKNAGKAPLLIEWLDSPHGPILAVVDNAALYMLEFTVRKNLDLQMRRLSKKAGRAILPGRTQITDQISAELIAYFKGQLLNFETPVALLGTDFQTRTWKALREIPAGQTRSYKDLAAAVGNPKGFRAVANANANNRLAIIVPCHRVIAADGGLGGYAGGLDKKRALLDLEKVAAAAQQTQTHPPS